MYDKKLIFHIDVNSAYLSWEAVYRLQHGENIDLRKVPSVVGGDPKSRHGVILAKSIPSKQYNILTGESLYSALQKYPGLIVVPPRYKLYMKCSNAMVDILKEYTPSIQRFSIDECFLDFTAVEHRYKDPITLAHRIKNRIKNELGFTVNIGISTNKLLAKVASDFKKPDMVHTLYPHEITTKMWPLPIEDLFMVGRATAPKLRKLNINTIGDLAKYDVKLLKYKFKNFGVLIWEYANGIEDSPVYCYDHSSMKGISNSTTTSFDVDTKEDAFKILLSLSEIIGMRLREARKHCSVVGIHVKNNNFISCSRQKQIARPTDCTATIFEVCRKLLNELWRNEPLRYLGIHITALSSNEIYQTCLFDEKYLERNRNLDKTIDLIRERFGYNSLIRGVFLHSKIEPLCKSIYQKDYPLVLSKFKYK